MISANCKSRRKLSVFIGLLATFTIITIIPAYADQVVKLTSGGTINVGFSTDPANPNSGDQTQLKVSFINKQTNAIQQHIDYKVSVMEGNNQVFGIPTTHTAEGSVTIPFQFLDAGPYKVNVEVDGILFQPIPPETATFTVNIGSASTPNNNSTNSTRTPEFGPVASLVLVIAIISAVIVTSKTRSLSKQ